MSLAISDFITTVTFTDGTKAQLSTDQTFFVSSVDDAGKELPEAAELNADRLYLIERLQAAELEATA